jgi:N utilization substance protein A
MKALAPARVREVRIDEESGTAEVIVPDFQLSLAIGREGQNARLAARLTGWRVDIRSENQVQEEPAADEYAEGEWVENASGELVWQPAEGGETISAADAGYAGAEPPAADAPASDAPTADAAPAPEAATEAPETEDEPEAVTEAAPADEGGTDG